MERIKLVEICNPKQWKTIPTGDLLDEGYSVYGANGVIGYYGEYNHENPVVAITCRGATCGSINITVPQAYVTGNAMCLDDVREDINIEYLYYCLKHFDFNGVISGSAQPQITRQGLNKVDITICSPEEQQVIVEKLKRVELIIKYRKNEIHELDNLIKARFVEMFGDININDKGWNSEPLGKLCTIVRGGSPRPIEQFLGGTIPWIKIGDATDGDNIYLNSTKEHIIQEGVKKSRLVKAGSLIFANCGVSLGFARIITFDGCIHDGWLAIEDIDEKLDKVFLLQSLNQMTEYFRAIAPAGTQPNLNTAIMKAYNQVLPPIEMQREFIKFLEQVDKSKFEVLKVA
ncbi:type I restriction enzyme, S subunit [Lachnospiraceae bacterium RM5]|nr:type I restriction enzyme, S subunit [Lachnospiraceae bacterium RM5]